jgi:hypothetical protein
MTRGVSTLDALRVLHEVEHLYLAVPDGLAIMLLVHGHALDPFSRAALKVVNGVEQGGKAGGIHYREHETVMDMVCH